MKTGKPVFSVAVWGDWFTVISVRAYREALLRQKPHDADDGEYFEYRILCDSTKVILEAIAAFSEKQLKCAVQVSFASTDGSLKAFASSDDGFSSDGPYAILQQLELPSEA